MSSCVEYSHQFALIGVHSYPLMSHEDPNMLSGGAKETVALETAATVMSLLCTGIPVSCHLTEHPIFEIYRSASDSLCFFQGLHNHLRSRTSGNLPLSRELVVTLVNSDDTLRLPNSRNEEHR